MKKKEVQYTHDTLPPLTDMQREQLEKLAERSDDQINYDDIPKLTEGQLAEFQRPAHYRPIKRQITTRLDADVLAWLKASGKGYQSRINAILRREMLAAIKSPNG